MTAGTGLLSHKIGALPSVSSRAYALIKATDYDAVNDRFTDLSGHGHHFVSGSSVGVDANDPVLVSWNSTHGKHLYIPGISGNYVDTPDSVSNLRFTGAFSIVAKIGPDSWAPSTSMAIVTKWQTNKQSWRFLLLGTGQLQFGWSTTGTDNTAQTSTSNLSGLAAKTVRWVRVDWVPDDGASHHTSAFYTATTTGPPTSGDWSPLGSTVSNTGTVTVWQDTAPVEMGTQLAGTSFIKPCRFWRVRIWNGAWNTTLAFDSDFSLASEPFTGTITDGAHGAVVTIHRASTGIKSTMIDRTSLIFGSTYLEAADHADWNLDRYTPATLVVCYRRQIAVTSTVPIVAKTNDTGTTPNPGWLMFEQSTPSASGRFTDGSTGGTAAASGAVEIGVAHMYWTVRNPATDSILYGRDSTLLNTSTDFTTGSISNTLPVRVGRLSGTTTSYSEPVIFSVAWFRSALSLSDIIRLQSELLVSGI
jgi:hypothetical protein